jgi:hypothetical protein
VICNQPGINHDIEPGALTLALNQELIEPVRILNRSDSLGVLVDAYLGISRPQPRHEGDNGGNDADNERSERDLSLRHAFPTCGVSLYSDHFEVMVA